MREEDDNPEQSASQYEALLLWQEDGGVRVGTVDPEQIKECREKLRSESMNNKSPITHS
jgi:hypothetical protein